MDHLDLYFDDGTNPTDEIVREFIKRVDYVIEVQKKKVAVHCKAGLGRTGVLIGGGCGLERSNSSVPDLQVPVHSI